MYGANALPQLLLNTPPLPTVIVPQYNQPVLNVTIVLFKVNVPNISRAP